MSLQWPDARLPELFGLLTRRLGSTAAPPPPAGSRAAWLGLAATHAGLEIEPVQMAYGELDTGLRRAAPALIQLGDGQWIGLARGGRRPRVIGMDGRLHTVSLATLVDWLGAPVEAALGPSCDALVAGLAPERRAAARRALLQLRGVDTPIEGLYLLRLPPGASFARQWLQAGLLPYTLALIAVHSLGVGLWSALWVLLGRAALQGRLDPGWLTAAGLALLSLVPLRMAEVWLGGRLAVGTGALLKRRLLQGALSTHPDEMRQAGAGQLLGRAIEAEEVEGLALGGGLTAVLALIEVTAALVVLGAGLHTILLLAWMVIISGLGLRYARQRRAWTRARLELTHALVEDVVGHRTRQVQQSPSDWHQDEDVRLERYLEDARALDQAATRFSGLAGRGWLALGLLGMGPLWLSGAEPAALAVTLGGVMLAWSAFVSLVSGFMQLTGAAIAGEQVRSIFMAGARPTPAGVAPWALLPPAGPLIQARGLRFAHPGRPEVLRGLDLQVQPGDHVLLQGPSGGGKSTLVALLLGLRQPTAGLLLVGGLDQPTLGRTGWRARVAAAPQFHENHVLTETISFNLLMGRNWPPTAADLEEAEQVCVELGLGPLLQRMPGGLNQMVGEVGWQLSHGERSRLFIARALLQGSDLLIFDESFAALDPENLERCLQVVRARARALLVVAHP